MVGLVLDDPCGKTPARSSAAARRAGRARGPECRWGAAPGPGCRGMLRHPSQSSSTVVPRGSISGLIMTIGGSPPSGSSTPGDEQPQTLVHLGSGETDAGVLAHRLEHVVDEALNGRGRNLGGVERRRPAAQHGVPHPRHLQDGHGAGLYGTVREVGGPVRRRHHVSEAASVRRPRSAGESSQSSPRAPGVVAILSILRESSRRPAGQGGGTGAARLRPLRPGDLPRPEGRRRHRDHERSG